MKGLSWTALRDQLEAIEEAWLGWSFPPTRRALADAGWRPDAPQRYCHRCGGSVGAGEVTPAGCGLCRGSPPVADAVVRLGPYEGRLREWVRAIKYRGWSEMAEALGHLLGRAIRARLDAGASKADLVVVPMPMPWQRRMYRGIDHARLIAAGAARRLEAPLLPMLSHDNGAPQVAVTATRRRRRGGRFALSRRARRLSLEGFTAILVDDVLTTGASLRRAARLIRRTGPVHVTAGVLAVTDDPGRRVRGPDGGPGEAAGPVLSEPLN